MEGIHSPTPLLKLFMSFSNNPRYFPLLVVHKPNNRSITPLPYIIKLLLGPNTDRCVINAILSLIEKLLLLKDFEIESPNNMDVDDKPLTKKKKKDDTALSLITKMDVDDETLEEEIKRR